MTPAEAAFELERLIREESVPGVSISNRDACTSLGKASAARSIVKAGRSEPLTIFVDFSEIKGGLVRCYVVNPENEHDEIGPFLLVTVSDAAPNRDNLSGPIVRHSETASEAIGVVAAWLGQIASDGTSLVVFGHGGTRTTWLFFIPNYGTAWVSRS